MYIPDVKKEKIQGFALTEDPWERPIVIQGKWTKLFAYGLWFTGVMYIINWIAIGIGALLNYVN